MLKTNPTDGTTHTCDWTALNWCVARKQAVALLLQSFEAQKL